MAGTPRVGQIATDNQLVGVRLDIDEAIVILPVDDVPLQRYVGSSPTVQTKVEWLEEDLTPQTATIATSGVSGTASPWTVTLADGDGATLRNGDVVTIRGRAYNIQFTVSGVSSAENGGTAVLTAFGSTGASDDPADADVLEIIGQLRDEGSDPEDGRSVDRETNYNYTQWGQEKVEVTRTDRKLGLYGLQDPYTHEVMKKFKELGIRFERSMVSGVRYQSGKKRFMGGLLYFIATNAVSNTGTNIYKAINDLLRKCYDQGATPDTLMVSPGIKQFVSNIDATLRRTTPSERVAGFTIDRVLTDFGTVDVVMNRHFPTTKGIAMQREFIQRKVFDGYRHEPLAKTGDADQGHIVGEFSLEVKNERAHGVLTITDAA